MASAFFTVEGAVVHVASAVVSLLPGAVIAVAGAVVSVSPDTAFAVAVLLSACAWCCCKH